MRLLFPTWCLIPTIHTALLVVLLLFQKIAHSLCSVTALFMHVLILHSNQICSWVWSEVGIMLAWASGNLGWFK